MGPVDEATANTLENIENVNQVVVGHLLNDHWYSGTKGLSDL